MTQTSGITIKVNVPDTTSARQAVSQFQTMAKQQNLSSLPIEVQAHSQSDYQTLQQESQSQSWKESNVTLLPFGN